MKTNVCIFNLNGNRAAVRDYANIIASMNVSFFNAYVMAFDKDNEILWTVQAGDDLDEVKAAINWQGVRRVEIYDHSADGTYKIEQVYITSRKSLTEYTSERSAADFVVIENRTAYTVGAWQAAEDDTQSGDNNEGEQIAAEPLRRVQKVAKVVKSFKAYAAKARALRPALVLYVWGLIIAALFALCFLSLPFVCLLVPYIFITAPTFKPTDFIFIAALEAIFIATGVAIWQLFRNGDLYNSWNDCKILTRPF